MGLVDAMRIGPDNGPDWKQLLKGPTFGSRHYFLNGRVWYNDPDPVYVRESVPLNHAQLICSWVAISGQLFVCSDWLPGLPAERLNILKRTMPSHGLHARPVDLFAHDPPRIWSLIDSRRQPHRNVVGLFNWDDQTQSISCKLSDLGLDEHSVYVAYDFWHDVLIKGVRGTLTVPVPRESCKILTLKPVSDHPQLLSTSRHVTQGIVDVLEEVWVEADRTLRGKSRIVGGDDYEIRVVVPVGWSAASVAVTNANGEVLPASVDQSGELIRIRIQPAASGEISWSVRF